MKKYTLPKLPKNTQYFCNSNNIDHKELVTLKELTEEFKDECDDHASDIDPKKKEDWFSITLGWAIAKGLKPDETIKFTDHIRQFTDLV